MISEIFSEDLMIPELKATTKNEVIQEMVDQLDRSGKLIDRSAFLEAVLHREAEYSTGIGMGVAIPHGKSNGVAAPALIFARSRDGVDFDSMDEKPTYLFFMVAVPESANDDHLKILGALSRKLMHQSVRDQLAQAVSYEEVIAIIS